jgi:hypothetical protein
MMGYGMEIQECAPAVYGGKLFGYGDARKMKSFRFLVDLRKLSEEDEFCFDARGQMPIQLNAEQFRIFVKLYDEDRKDLWGNELISTLQEIPEVMEMMNSSRDKLLHWE